MCNELEIHLTKLNRRFKKSSRTLVKSADMADSVRTHQSFFWKAHTRACEVNICRTFILSISLFLEPAGSNLAQTLLNPPKVVWYDIDKVCLQVPKMADLGIELFPCNHSINAVLTNFNSTRQRNQVKFKAKIVNL